MKNVDIDNLNELRVMDMLRALQKKVDTLEDVVTVQEARIELLREMIIEVRDA